MIKAGSPLSPLAPDCDCQGPTPLAVLRGYLIRYLTGAWDALFYALSNGAKISHSISKIIELIDHIKECLKGCCWYLTASVVTCSCSILIVPRRHLRVMESWLDSDNGPCPALTIWDYKQHGLAVTSATAQHLGHRPQPRGPPQA